MAQYLPYPAVRERDDVVVVDASHPQGYALSHWRGANDLADLHDDVSVGIVLKALQAGHPSAQLPWVTNNHFDVDGFLGVWSLVEPDLALSHANLLREAALIGDFREYHPNRADADQALKLVCWINTVEAREFYRPFGSRTEMTDSEAKYRYFIPRLAEVLQDLDAHRDDWQQEYERVKRDWNLLHPSAQGHIEKHPDLRQQINRAPKPLHYYALFSDSADSDLVITLYPDQRYELEYKYTTWVDLASREVLPRVDLRPLAQRLNREERSGPTWVGDGITDTGPLLRLELQPLSKAERFAHPYQRPIHASSIAPEKWLAMVQEYFTQALQGVSPRARWTWDEMKAAVDRP